MSQPTQCFNTNLPDGSYSVIDNGAAGAVSTNITPYSAGSGGPPTGGGAGNMTGSTVPNFNCVNGATSQDTNTFGNGNIPDSVAKATTILNSPLTARVLFRNPA